MEILPETSAVGGSIGLSVKTDLIQKVDALLRQVDKGLRDFRPAWRRIAGEILIPSIRSAFSGKASQDGQSWAPLSRAYAARKGAGDLLRSTGRLEAAVTSESGGGGALRTFGKKLARVGTSIGYSLPLQWGYGTGSRRSAAALRSGKGFRTRSAGARSAVPARSFIGWNDSMREQSGQIVVEFLEQLVAKNAAATGGA